MSSRKGFEFECRLSFLIHLGSPETMGSILFCIICMLLMLVLEAEPHIEQPYIQIDIIMEVYNSFLICRGVCKHSKLFNCLILSLSLVWSPLMRAAHIIPVSRISPKYLAYIFNGTTTKLRIGSVNHFLPTTCLSFKDIISIFKKIHFVHSRNVGMEGRNAVQ